MENSSAPLTTASVAVAVTVEVTLPALLRVDARENGNTVQQIAVPPWSGKATVEPLEQSRMRGFTITPADGAPPVVLLTNSAQPSPELTHVLRQRGAQIVLSGGSPLDLSGAKWIKHPEPLPQPADLADYEQQISDALVSWTDAFRYKRESTELQIDGLRPPQIGAIYAVQAHWTINVDPATVVLPTGVGKTETMLSILVAERCPRLLVVVPTDALRTQISEKFLLPWPCLRPRPFRSFWNKPGIPSWAY